MIGASKILTVSYGTFSCTLEGFDDPFNTMRAIAEYFRDLAAEDRYFGAEPPTPDAAMLLKIAEREVQRRVEAKIQENGVVLRTGDAMEAPSFASAPQSQAPVSVVRPPAEPITSPPPMPDGVAAKLLRIRAAVTNAELAAAPAAPATVFAEAEPILADYSEDQHADDIIATDVFAATFDEQRLNSDPVDADVWGEPVADLADSDLTEPELTPSDQGASDAMLDRIVQDAAAPDLPTLTDTAPEADLSVMSEDLADAAPLAPIADTTTETNTDLAQLVAATAEADSAANTAESDVFDDEMADADYAVSADDLADLQALDATPDVAASEDAANPDAVSHDPAFPDAATAEAPAPEAEIYDEDYDQPLPAKASDATEPSLEDRFADDENMAEQPTDIAVDPVLEEVDPVLQEIDNAYAPLDEPARGPSEKALRARARVLKVRRTDAVAADTIPAEASAEVAAMLAADAEDDLRRDLRALQVDTDTPNPNDVDDEAGTEDDARKRLDAAGEEAVSRLIEQTNEAMAVPENRRRLSAIAHLKAAVAATVADRFSKGGSAAKEPNTTRLDPYREDLARVVRPQPAAGSEDAAAAPRPAPLVLVSAQRIDRPRTAPGDSTTPLSSVPTAPVRPRRVTSAQVAVEPVTEIDDEDEDIDTAVAFSDSRGFAEFSERLGANSLAEILEAAAAYSVCVEGRPYFSRPQLMGQIGALSADSEYSREDGLRTFGALLREGRIQKIKRGQFVLTEGSRYLAEARKIAG